MPSLELLIDLIVIAFICLGRYEAHCQDKYFETIDDGKVPWNEENNETGANTQIINELAPEPFEGVSEIDPVQFVEETRGTFSEVVEEIKEVETPVVAVDVQKIGAKVAWKAAKALDIPYQYCSVKPKASMETARERGSRRLVFA